MIAKTVYKTKGGGEWGGWEARLKEDDSLVIEYWSRYQGSTTGEKYRYDNTGLLSEIEKDDELEAGAAIDSYLERHDLTAATRLHRGYTVE